MIKIATHDSGTGERDLNLLHSIFSIFSKCQDKTIKEQWENGARYFDLRVCKTLHLAHGMWKSKVTIEEALSMLNELSLNDTENETHVMITIEQNYKESVIKELIDYLMSLKKKYTNLTFISINKKRPQWETVVFYKYVKCASDYSSVPWITEWKKINFKNWKRYIPIPRVLHKNHVRKYTFNENYFVMVDFL